MTALRTARLVLGALALSAALSLSAHAGISGANYDVQGTVTPGSPVTGSVTFGNQGNMMRATFTSNTFGQTIRTFDGFYSELNLLLVGFWSFNGNVGGTVAGPAAVGGPGTGSGIRLFFGLLVFGSFEDAINNEAYSFSGTFDQIFGLPSNDEPRRASGLATGHDAPAAILRRRSISPERI